MKAKIAIVGAAALLAGIPSAGSAQPPSARDCFLDGCLDRGNPAPQVEPTRQERVSLFLVLVRQVRPYWYAPKGSEQMRTTVRFDLNRDGSLAGEPIVISQDGGNGDADLAAEHARRARHAVIKAAPFNLPPEFYHAWKRVTLTMDQRMGS